MTPPILLREALEAGSLALFLGADLPTALTGVPSRADLARELARRHVLPEMLPLAEVAQRVGSRFVFTSFLKSALDRASLSPGPFHQRVAALVRRHHIRVLITTAWDGLLDLAFQQEGMDLNYQVREDDVTLADPGRPTLIKLYGDISQTDTLVITDRDHLGLLRGRDREAILGEVLSAFRRSTVLILGHDLSDPDVRALLDHVTQGALARPVYAAWQGVPEADVRVWRERGIALLDAGPLSLLANLEIMPPADDMRQSPSSRPAMPLVPSIKTLAKPDLLYLCHAQQDDSLVQELELQLSPLRSLLRSWSALHLFGGDTAQDQIGHHLAEARIIIPLVTARFLSDAGCMQLMERALMRRQAGQAIVIPVLADYCHWQLSPLGPLAPLPAPDRPVSAWSNRNEAWHTVVHGILHAAGQPTFSASSGK